MPRRTKDLGHVMGLEALFLHQVDCHGNDGDCHDGEEVEADLTGDQAADLVNDQRSEMCIRDRLNNAVFILRVGVLGYVEDTGKIALTKIVIFP